MRQPSSSKPTSPRKKRVRAAKNILMRDGTARRVPEDVCEQLLASGQAQRYISNTVYRALALGIEVKDPSTRDADGALREKIRAAHEKAEKRRKKEEKRREQEELDLLEEDAA